MAQKTAVCRLPVHQTNPIKSKEKHFGNPLSETTASRTIIHFPDYKRAGGKLTPREFGRLMSLRLGKGDRRRGTMLNNKLDVPFEGFALEVLQRLLMRDVYKRNIKLLEMDCLPRRELLGEISIIVAAATTYFAHQGQGQDAKKTA
jgi:hypothetical protein